MLVATRQALVVGIDDYTASPLIGCVNDAKDTATILQMPEYGFEVQGLIDGQATSERIRQELAWALRASDVAVIFFAGHGVMTDVGPHFLAHDHTDFTPGVDLDYVRRLMNAPMVGCKSIVLILDCCHSGAARPRSADNRIARLTALTQDDVSRSLWIALPGRVLLAACEGDQLAYPTPDGAHGVFTACLHEGMLGAACDEHGTLTVHALYDYVSATLDR
jgi:uncharacterized caspase-like protein